MKSIYFASSLMWRAPAEKLMNTARALNAAGIELWAQHAQVMEYDTRELTALSERLDVKFVVHAKSWDLNFAALNPAIREASLNELYSSIDLAAEINAAELTLHPPRYTLAAMCDSAMQYGRDGLKCLTEYAGKKGVAISLEIMEKLPKELVTTDIEFLSFTGGISDIGCTLDIAHCESEKEFWQYADAVSNITKLHISNRKGSRLHTPLYDGDYDFRKLIPKLSALNKPLIIEGFDASDDFSVLMGDIDLIQKIQEEEKICL